MLLLRHIAITLLCLAGTIYSRTVTVCSNTTTTVPADFLFLIDGSASMCTYNIDIANSLSTFVTLIASKNINARYAVVAFGGLPSILLPFTSVYTDAKTALQNVGCKRSGWEAGLEAIRMTLNSNNGSDMGQSCLTGYNGTACKIIWRAGSERQIIMATDEDSDIPYLNSYLMPGQGNALCPSGYANGCTGMTIEPPFQPRIFSNQNYYRNASTPITLEAPYYQEIELTANLLISSGTSISLLMKSDFNANTAGPQSTFNSYNQYFVKNVTDKSVTSDTHTSIVQYGHPNLQSQSSSFGNFNPTETLSNLQLNSLGLSLQAKMLGAGGMMRVYKIQDLLNTTTGPNLLSNMYVEITNDITNCSTYTVTDYQYDYVKYYEYIIFHHNEYDIDNQHQHEYFKHYEHHIVKHIKYLKYLKYLNFFKLDKYDFFNEHKQFYEFEHYFHNKHCNNYDEYNIEH
ncbi:hypothetical protein HDU78_003589 [Chytriomyces hyalinus]|nr:hypothetical protein HDU78_003589 [Chytriomyces hyalinus]